MSLPEKVRNRVARVRQHRWRMRAYRSTEAHVVLGGSPRSGTTLLRRLLDRHASLCCGPEMSLFLPTRFRLEPLAALSGIDPDELRKMLAGSRSQGELIDAFSARYRTLQGKSRWAEKTPHNVRHFAWIAERFPEARLIHVIRDGRDVVCSAREHGERRWIDGTWVWSLQPRPTDWYAHAWVADTQHGMRFRGHPGYLEVRYEDLATDPETTLRGICAFLGEPFDPAMIPDAPPGASAAPDQGRPNAGSIGRWQRDLTPADRAIVETICGPRLRELGYLE
jgi:hypothetical protein